MEQADRELTSDVMDSLSLPLLLAPFQHAAPQSHAVVIVIVLPIYLWLTIEANVCPSPSTGALAATRDLKRDNHVRLAELPQLFPASPTPSTKQNPHQTSTAV